MWKRLDEFNVKVAFIGRTMDELIPNAPSPIRADIDVGAVVAITRANYAANNCYRQPTVLGWSAIEQVNLQQQTDRKVLVNGYMYGGNSYQFDAAESAHAKRSNDFDILQSYCSKFIDINTWRRRQRRYISQATVTIATTNMNSSEFINSF